MSVITKFKAWFSGGANEGGPSSTVHIIDLAGLAGSNGNRLSPRDRVQLLEKVAAFVEREQIEAHILIEGRPLREAPEEALFKTAHVVYAETAEGLQEQALNLARRNSGNSMVITQNRALEEAARASGAQTLRASSLRRGLDEATGRGGESGRGGGRGRRRSRTRRGGGSGGGNGGRNRGDNAPKAESKDAKPQKQPAKDGVSDLIDLV